MKALIDLDPLVYQYADLRFPDGNSMPAYYAERYCMDKIHSIVENCGADSWRGFLTFGPDNFRIKLATIADYKGNRKNKEKPPLHDHLRGWLSDLPNVQMVMGMEADDMLSILQWENFIKGEEEVGQPTIICTLDKDLDMVPGYHYRWEKGNVKAIDPWYQTELEGLKCFYCQLLTGDVVDNIKGLYGVGPKSVYLGQVRDSSNETEMFGIIRDLYRKWYGNYGDQFLLENGRLLWMKRTIDDMWEFPV